MLKTCPVPSLGLDLSVFSVLYSTLLHMPRLRIHRVGGCWDRTLDSCNFGIGGRRSNHSLDLVHKLVIDIIQFCLIFRSQSRDPVPSPFNPIPCLHTMSFTALRLCSVYKPIFDQLTFTCLKRCTEFTLGDTKLIINL
jgi:hypothetical protein